MKRSKSMQRNQRGYRHEALGKIPHSTACCRACGSQARNAQEGGIKIDNPVIAVDFDGVIHEYKDGWRLSLDGDLPVEGAFDGLQALYDDGWRIIIFTARLTNTVGELVPERVAAVYRWIDSHRETHHTFEIYDITNVKPINARVLLDDNAIRFVNWKQALADIEKPTICTSCLNKGFPNRVCPECERSAREVLTEADTKVLAMVTKNLTKAQNSVIADRIQEEINRMKGER